jgi:serine/threonine-protein kinase
MAADADPDPDDPHLGRIIGGARLFQKVGAGPSGTVYLGHQPGAADIPDRTVAVKIIHDHVSTNAAFRERFIPTTKAIARLCHPHLVMNHDFGQLCGNCPWYVVNEYVDGPSLATLIAGRRTLRQKQVASIMAPCLGGLSIAGKKGIVHRGIRPANILLTQSMDAKLSDFGLARDVGMDTDPHPVAPYQLSFMSPEQTLGLRLDSRSDIYSLGVTAYLALTGRNPFHGPTASDITTKQRDSSPTPPHQITAGISQACSDVVMRMLAKDPKDRFEHADACRIAWQGIND